MIDFHTKSLEDSCKDFVIIIAGYIEEMDSLLELNPGLPSRFPVHSKFADYEVDELMCILQP